MPATMLHTHRVEALGPPQAVSGVRGCRTGRRARGEVWFQEPGDSSPDLLIKYLFTSEKLSVQVHPDDEQAHARGLPRGKDECWTILTAEPDSTIALGPKADDQEQLRSDARDGSVEADLDWVPVRQGDFYYAPSGTIHAIGAGLTVIEVQQNSETTYRLYDYGSDRELHLEDGVDVAHLTPYQPIVSPGSAGEGRDILVEGPKFVLERWAAGEHPVALPEGRTAWLIPITGSGEVAGVAFQAGQCLTVTGSETVTLSADGDALFAYAGTKRL